MSYISDPNSFGLDISIKKDWYSISSDKNDAESILDDYCAFCLTNFRQYHPILNNVCQSCGRVAEPIIRDDQEFMKASSNNSLSSTDDSVFQGASLDIDYSPIEVADPTKDTIYGSGQRMTAVGAGEAIRKINEVDRMQSKVVSAMLRNEKFLVKTNIGKDKMVQFDSNNASEGDNLI